MKFLFLLPTSDGILAYCHFRDRTRCQLDVHGGKVGPEDRNQLARTAIRELKEEMGVDLAPHVPPRGALPRPWYVDAILNTLTRAPYTTVVYRGNKEVYIHVYAGCVNIPATYPAGKVPVFPRSGLRRERLRAIDPAWRPLNVLLDNVDSFPYLRGFSAALRCAAEDACDKHYGQEAPPPPADLPAPVYAIGSGETGRPETIRGEDTHRAVL